MGAVGAFRLRMKLAIAFLALTSLLYGVECHLGSTTVNWKYYYFDTVLPAGDKCGQQKPVTGWTVNYDRYKAYNTGGKQDNQYFNSGYFLNFTGVLKQLAVRKVKVDKHERG